MNFPHLDDSRFPDLQSVNVYKYKNDLDYSQFDNPQMNITLCKVPWDMGEVHVGNRTVGGIGNVVHFGSARARDKWFADLPDDECIRFSTEYRRLHTDNFMDVELPFDVAAMYNYVAVEYPAIANDDHLLKHETINDGFKKWFWFVREVERLANNTTRLHILPDTWQTFIYDFPIKSMMLERGHMPVFETMAGDYLQNPLENSKHLLAEDVSFGEPRISKKSSEFLINGKDIVAVIVSSANPAADYGTKAAGTWHTPNGPTVQHGVPSYHAFYVARGSLSAFLNSMQSQAPQFAQTIKAVFFVNRSLCYSGATFTFCGVTCTWVSNTYTTQPLHRLLTSDFGFDSKYAMLAKLYTYPYSVLEISDETGAITELRIEDTTGTLKVETAYSLVFPWIRLDAHITGAGKAARKQLTWYDIGERHVDIAGNWYQLLRSWSIPTFGITQSASVNNDYSTHFDRAQAATAAANAKANADATADTMTANANLQVAANTANNTAAITKLNNDTARQNQFSSSVFGYDRQLSNDMATSTIAADQAQAALAASTTGAKSALNTVASLATLDIAGAITSAIGGSIDAANIQASTQIGVALTSAQEMANALWSGAKEGASLNTALDLASYSVNLANSQTTTANGLTSGTTANSVATQKANANRDKATADSAIANQVKQAALGAPLEFGAFNAGEHATTRPQGLFCNVVTQPDGAIAQAGDYFLRYGYALNQMVDFETWHYGKYFTYWQCSDLWTEGNAIPDRYADGLRFFLLGGVTVWRRPEDIGKRSIYENI